MALFPSMFSDGAIVEYRLDMGKTLIWANGARCQLEAVTSSPRALEGKRTTFALKNETHHWLPNNDGTAMAEVIERNLVKARGGDARALSISNAHNPGEGSDAEMDYEAYLASATGRGQDDVLYDSLEAPAGIDLSDVEQVKLAVLTARGDSTWLDVDRIAATIMDPRTREGESRRFYLNQVVAGDDVWLARERWDELAKPRPVPEGTTICVGFDGSDTDDWSAFRCETVDGYQFTPRFPDGKPMVWNPAQHGGYVPRHEVHAALAHLIKYFKVERVYCDPHMWQSEIDNWSAEYGDKVVLRWETSRTKQMAQALERFRTDVLQGSLKHDGDPMTSRHIGNAQADRKPAGVVIRKDKQVSQNKIDLAMSSALAHEAALDATATGWGRKRSGLTRAKGRVSGY
jgi:phage terminase large subunit-like protein